MIANNYHLFFLLISTILIGVFSNRALSNSKKKEATRRCLADPSTCMELVNFAHNNARASLGEEYISQKYYSRHYSFNNSLVLFGEEIIVNQSKST